MKEQMNAVTSYERREKTKETLETISTLPKPALGKTQLFHDFSPDENCLECGGSGATAPARPRSVRCGASSSQPNFWPVLIGSELSSPIIGLRDRNKYLVRKQDLLVVDESVVRVSVAACYSYSLLFHRCEEYSMRNTELRLWHPARVKARE